MEGLDWNEIIRSPYPVSSLIGALLPDLRNAVFKLTIVVRTDGKRWFDDRCVLAHHAKVIAYKMWSRSRKQADCGKSIGGLVVILRLCMWMLKKHSLNEANHSWLPLRRLSLVWALACHLWWTEEIRWSGLQMKKPHGFWGTLTLNSVEIDFSNRILVILVQNSVAFRSSFIRSLLLDLGP